MMRSTRAALAALALILGIFAGGVAAGQAGAVSATPPHIVVKPNNVMVNTKVTLTGAGFKARTKLVIKECGRTSWVVTQHPCDSDNTISVVTDAHGRFVKAFKVELCPRSQPASGPVTEETCYIGNPQPHGVDTISLVGAARVTVTYP